MTTIVTKIDDNWTPKSIDSSMFIEQENKDRLTRQNGSKKHYNRMRAWIEKYQKYVDTHEYSNGHRRYYKVSRTPFYFPLKFKRNGEFVKWPEYNQDPQGLYEVKKKKGGYSYETATPYSITLTMIAYSPYKAPATYVQAYESHYD